MKALIFNGAPESGASATSTRISSYLGNQLSDLNIESEVFNISESGIPLFDLSITEVPESVKDMNQVFREADIHIWLTPLYHGSMTGAMKNCLDWMEYSAKSPKPYLTGKLIGLVCWADGVQAVQGINAMDAVAKALRAWTSPYNVPIKRSELFDDAGNVGSDYQQRFSLLIQILTEGPDRASN